MSQCIHIKCPNRPTINRDTIQKARHIQSKHSPSLGSHHGNKHAQELCAKIQSLIAQWLYTTWICHHTRDINSNGELYFLT